MNGKVPHPIPYQGSKRQLAPAILSYFPTVVERLVEPFAGSAAMSLAAAYNERAKRFWINDGHTALIALWRAIVSQPELLANEYEQLWHEQLGQERDYYDKVRARFNSDHLPSDFLYLLARCVKACIRYNSSGEFNNTPDNRRKGARPDAMRLRIRGAFELLRDKSVLTAWDFSRVLT